MGLERIIGQYAAENTLLKRALKSPFHEGVEYQSIDNISVPVYSAAKTVADCFKYRNKIGLDVAIEALRDALRQKSVTVDDLWHYSKICRISNVIRPYVEAMQ